MRNNIKRVSISKLKIVVVFAVTILVVLSIFFVFGFTKKSSSAGEPYNATLQLKTTAKSPVSETWKFENGQLTVNRSTLSNITATYEVVATGEAAKKNRYKLEQEGTNYLRDLEVSNITEISVKNLTVDGKPANDRTIFILQSNDNNVDSYFEIYKGDPNTIENSDRDIQYVIN